MRPRSRPNLCNPDRKRCQHWASSAVSLVLCYKDWSVYLATFAGACVVIACNTLPFIDSLVGDYVSGMFTAVKSFFFMILFGCLQSKIYTESGAAYTIADTVMNRLLKENMSNTG